MKNQWEGMVELYDLEGRRVRILGAGLLPLASPNRRYLAFDAHPEGSYSHDLVVVDVEDPELKVRTLVKARASLLLGDFSWAPTSDALVFNVDSLSDVSEGEIWYGNLCVVDLKGTVVEVTPGVRGVVESHPVWTEGGILFRRVDGDVPVMQRLRVVRK